MEDADVLELPELAIPQLEPIVLEVSRRCRDEELRGCDEDDCEYLATLYHIRDVIAEHRRRVLAEWQPGVK